jgi:endoglucanase
MLKKSLSVVLMISLVFTLLFAVGVEPSKAAGTFVDNNGQLKVSGNQMVNQSGQAIQLKGMSSHGLQWYGHYVNYDSIKWLRDDWGSNVFRAAMYTDSGGYISDPSVKDKVHEAVQAAIDLGIYVIIDWHILHDNDPNIYKEEAKAFFKEMANLYGSYPNVIYEIANEPNGNVTWDSHIKPYAEEVIPVIRAIDPDNIIVVGTGTWSQDVHHAADNPLSYSNVMYTAHFYAGTHGQWLRDRIDYARNKGLAIFVTEWGTSDASGGGGVYLTESKQWTDFMASRKISWANWSLADKAEASAALNPGASTSGGWTDSNLSTSGKFVRDEVRAGSSTVDPNPTPTSPAAPTGLTAGAGDGQVSLNWNSVSGADSYNVKRSTTSGESYTTIASNVTTTGYTDTRVSNGTNYYYVISAVNSVGESSNSNQVSATPTTSSSTGGGTGTGLNGEYYDNMDFTNLKVTRTDANVNFNWGTGSPASSMGIDTFSVRWTGQVQPIYSQTYTFYTTSDDGVRLWVNGAQVINNWTDHAPTENSGTIALTAGQKYDIKMEYYESGGGAVAQLAWSSPNQSKQNIPQSQLYPSTGGTTPTPSKPAAPTGLTAGAGDGQVSLSWNSVSGADSYNVKRSTTSGGPYTTVAANVTATSYTDSTVTNGTTYYYVVSAVNGVGESMNSSQVSATPRGVSVDPPTGDLVVQYRAADTNAGDNQFKPHFRIVNNGSSAVNLSELTIRYWFTIDGQQSQTFNCDYAAAGCSNVNGSFVQMSTAAAGADHYLEVSFTSSAGSIAAGGNSGEIQTRNHKTNWSGYNESDDYSFDPTKTAFVDWDRVTLYQNGQLVWGIQP